jgi:hypothetical protein
MRTLFPGLVGVILHLTFASIASADIPPPPPPELTKELPPFGPENAPAFRPSQIAIAGLSAGAAIVLIGLGAARGRGRSGVCITSAMFAVVVLAATGVGVMVVHRAWEAHQERLAQHEAETAKREALKAEYEKTLANWRPLGPVRPERFLRIHREIPLATAVFGASTQSAFPQVLPWAALAMNVEKRPCLGGRIATSS